MKAPVLGSMVAVLMLLTPVPAPAAETGTAEVPAVQADSGPSAAPRVTANREHVEEITVTARRREERLQDVPISITAFNNDRLREMGATRIDDISNATVNFKLDREAGSVDAARVYIRGVGQDKSLNTWEPGVGMYVDGIYYGRAQGSIFDVLDIERVEVMRGPQGTLFGRNSPGGAINIVTAKPYDAFGGEATVGAGNYDSLRTRAWVNIPLLGESVATRLALATSQRDGFVQNDFLGEDLDDQRSITGRAQFLFHLGEDVELLLSGERSKSRQRAQRGRCVLFDPTTGVQTLLGFSALFGFIEPFPANCAETRLTTNRSDAPSRDDLDVYGASATFTWDLGPFTFKSISAWRQIEFTVNGDSDLTDQPVLRTFGDEDDQTQITQELQLSSTSFDGRLSWVTGLFWFRETAEQSRQTDSGANLHIITGGLADFELFDFRTVANLSYAAFAEGTFDLTEQLSLTAGIRRTSEKKEMERLVQTRNTNRILTMAHARERFDAWTPRLNATYRFNDQLMVYGGWSRGFKSGGFNGLASGSFGQLDPFEEEFVEAWEVGLKSTWFDNRVSVNFAFFYNDYEDIQLQVAEEDPTSISGTRLAFNIRNAAEAIVQGFELETTAQVLPNLILRVGIGLTDAEYDEFTEIDLVTLQPVDRTDLEFTNTPELTYAVGAQYSLPLLDLGELTLGANWKFQGKTYYEAFNHPDLVQSKYGLLDARVSLLLPDERTEIALYGRNLLDREYLVGGRSLGSFGFVAQFIGEPAQYGIEVRRRFGD